MNSIYLDADNGNDFSARLGDPSAPAKTLDAAFGLLDDILRQGKPVTIYGRPGDEYQAKARRAGTMKLSGGDYDIALVSGNWVIYSDASTYLVITSVAAANLTVYAGGGQVDLRGSAGLASVYGGVFYSSELTVGSGKSLTVNGCMEGIIGIPDSAGAVKVINSHMDTVSIVQSTGATCRFLNCVLTTDFTVNNLAVSAIGCLHVAHTGTATLTNTGSTVIT